MGKRRVFVGLFLVGMVVGCSSFGATAETATVMEVPMSTSSAVARSHFLKGLHELDLGKAPDARRHFQSASKADPDFALAHLGIAYSSSFRTPLRDWAARSLTISVSPEDIASNLEAASMKAGNASEAEQAWINAAVKGFNNDLEGQLVDVNRLTKLAPSSPRAWLQLADCQAALGRHEDARKAGMKALDVSPGFVPAYLWLEESNLYYAPRDYAMAETYLKKILKLQPNEYRSQDLLGDFYRAQGNLTKARIAYTRAAELDPDNGMALQQLGHVNSFLGNFDAARANYQAAMDLSDPEAAAEFGVWKALVSIYAGNPRRAISELEELVVAIDTMAIAEPRSPKINVLTNIVLIAAHYSLEDSAQKAIQMCQSIMMQQADQVGNEEFRRRRKAQLAYLEGMLAARMGSFEVANTRAHEFMDHVKADMNPRKNEPAHEIIGMVNLFQGNYQEAIKHYELIPSTYPYGRYHLALAHERAGHSKVARAMFEDIAGYNFNNDSYCLIRKDALTKTDRIVVADRGEGEGKTETVMLPGGVPLEMVQIPAGTFQMGRYPGEQDSYGYTFTRAHPQHEVTLTQSFWMGKYVVTKAQWTAVMGTTPWSGQADVIDDPDSPAVWVLWDDAQSFITALNSFTGKTFRLPSEAEWESACRAGTTTRFYWGDDPSYTVGNDYAWWQDNAGEQYAHVVGSKLPNAWGLYDMIGNVWEFCEDRYEHYPGGGGSVSDPTGAASGSDRVYRGCAWDSNGRDCRSAYRGYDGEPTWKEGNLGFRLAR